MRRPAPDPPSPRRAAPPHAPTQIEKKGYMDEEPEEEEEEEEEVKVTPKKGACAARERALGVRELR